MEKQKVFHLVFLKSNYFSPCGMHRPMECQTEKNKENRPCQVSGCRGF